MVDFEEGPVTHQEWVSGRDWDDSDRSGESVINLLKELGLLPKHRLLDFGCGPLRIGRWLIPYLDKDRYFGIEPNLWLVEMARLEEVPEEIFKDKMPTFSDEDGHDLRVFGARKFDFVLASAVLMHSSHRQIDTFVGGLPAVLKKGGIALAEIRATGPDYEGDEWVYPKAISHYLSCVSKRAESLGLETEELPEQPFPGVWFTVTKI